MDTGPVSNWIVRPTVQAPGAPIERPTNATWGAALYVAALRAEEFKVPYEVVDVYGGPTLTVEAKRSDWASGVGSQPAYDQP